LFSDCVAFVVSALLETFAFSRRAPKVIPSILVCWLTTLEADAGGMEVEV
jgi:hypothetical protein